MRSGFSNLPPLLEQVVHERNGRRSWNAGRAFAVAVRTQSIWRAEANYCHRPLVEFACSVQVASDCMFSGRPTSSVHGVLLGMFIECEHGVRKMTGNLCGKVQASAQPGFGICRSLKILVFFSSFFFCFAGRFYCRSALRRLFLQLTKVHVYLQNHVGVSGMDICVPF